MQRQGSHSQNEKMKFPKITCRPNPGQIAAVPPEKVLHLLLIDRLKVQVPKCTLWPSHILLRRKSICSKRPPEYSLRLIKKLIILEKSTLVLG